MRYLRKLRGRMLAGLAWALIALFWLVPTTSHAAVPQTPTKNTTLTLSLTGQSGKIQFKGQLTTGGHPISGAAISLGLDSRVVAQATTDEQGSYSATTDLPGAGDHVATATFGGNANNRPAARTEKFTIKTATNPTTSPTTAPATSAQAGPAAVTIAATLSPSPVAAGAVLVVSGTLTSNGTPIDSARLDISCDFGGSTAMSATDAAGAFTANLSLPSTGQPSSLTVTVDFAGDDRFAASRRTVKAQVLAAETPTPVPTPTIAPESSLPPIASVTATRETVASSFARRDAPTAASSVGFILAAVALYALGSLGVVWFLAWRRHELLPGERRGFGSDFGRRHSA